MSQQAYGVQQVLLFRLKFTVQTLHLTINLLRQDQHDRQVIALLPHLPPWLGAGRMHFGSAAAVAQTFIKRYNHTDPGSSSVVRAPLHYVQACAEHTWYFFQSLLSFFVFSAASSAKLLNL